MRGRVGEVLNGKWRLDSFIGRGGSADVYAATHRNGKRAAVKIVNPAYAASPDLVKRFLREGYVANSLNHTGAVSVLDDDRCDDGSVYLVMELLEGASLSEISKKGPPLSLDAVLRIADEVLDVLAVAHERGIVHRDIKPANLFLTHAGVTKVLDFGIARLLEPEAGEPLTLTGAAIGTPAYMAPEQARGRWELVDGRTDLWALGATLIALLTGRKPRQADTANEELLVAMTLPIPPFATFVPSAPPPLCALIDQAVAYERDLRFPSARDMQARVRAVRMALQPLLSRPLDISGAGASSAGVLPVHTVNLTPHSNPSYSSGRSPMTPAPMMAMSPMTPAPRTPSLSGSHDWPAADTHGSSATGGLRGVSGTVNPPAPQGSLRHRALVAIPILLFVVVAGAAGAHFAMRPKPMAQATASTSSETSNVVAAAATPSPSGTNESKTTPSLVAPSVSASSPSPIPFASLRASSSAASTRPPTTGPKPSAAPNAPKKPECTDVFSCRNE